MTEHAPRAKRFADQREHLCDSINAHDVRGIGRKYRIVGCGRNIRRQDIERYWRQQVLELRVANPCADASVIFIKVTCLPTQIRQLTGKSNRVLSCARTNLEYGPAIRKLDFQHLKNGTAVSLGVFGKRSIRHFRPRRRRRPALPGQVDAHDTN